MVLCKTGNCDKQAYFNYEEYKKGEYCKEHKKENMVNVKDKRCIEPNCKKIPSFSNIGEQKRIYCSEHKEIETSCFAIVTENDFEFHPLMFCLDKETEKEYFNQYEGWTDKNKIIEYQGDQYHANPLKYKATDYPHPFRKNMSAEDIWEYDKNKLDIANENGYNIFFTTSKIN